MPETAPISLNVPLCSLWKTKFCTVSLATTKSIHPSPSKSTGATPSVFAIGEPAAALVVIKARERAGKVHGPTVGATDADEPVVHLEINLPGPLDIIADE